MTNLRFYRNTSSLAKRVLFICFCFLVTPLIIFTLLLADKETRLQKRDQRVQLTLIGESFIRLTQEWIALKESNLDLILYLLNENPTLEDSLGQFANGSTLFVLENGVYKASSDPSLKGQATFLENEPVQIAPLLPERSPAIILMKNNVATALDANTWVQSLAQMQQYEGTFSIALIDEEGKIVASNKTSGATNIQNTFYAPGTPFKFQIALTSEGLEGTQKIKLLNSLLHFLLILLIAGGIGALWLIRRLSRPLQRLHLVMNQIEQGDLNARYQNDKLGFEINQIGRHFNETLDALLQQRLAKELLLKELAIGHEIQKSLFPKELPNVPGIEMAAGFLPAKEVAGDFYDLFLKQNNQLLIVIADASDKGISACLYSLLLRSVLRAQVNVRNDLATAIYEANDLFCQDTGDSGNFATAWIGLYDLKSKSLDYCNAGHPPALLLKQDGTLQELNHGVGALGISELKTKPELHSVTLNAGDQLLLVTDGIIEAQDSEGKFFGKKRLFDFLMKLQNKTPRESVDLLIEEIQHFPKELNNPMILQF